MIGVGLLVTLLLTQASKGTAPPTFPYENQMARHKRNSPGFSNARNLDKIGLEEEEIDAPQDFFGASHLARAGFPAGVPMCWTAQVQKFYASQ